MRLRGKQLDGINAALKNGTAEDFSAALQKTCAQAEGVGQFVPALGSAPTRPRIVCLCGSTRFWKAFQEQSLRLTKKGIIVLSIGCATASDDEHGITPEEKVIFDELHLRKIDLADEVLVLNVGGYIGPSTRREVVYATMHRKLVELLEPQITPECAAALDALLAQAQNDKLCREAGKKDER